VLAMSQAQSRYTMHDNSISATSQKYLDAGRKIVLVKPSGVKKLHPVTLELSRSLHRGKSGAWYPAWLTGYGLVKKADIQSDQPHPRVNRHQFCSALSASHVHVLCFHPALDEQDQLPLDRYRYSCYPSICEVFFQVGSVECIKGGRRENLSVLSCLLHGSTAYPSVDVGSVADMLPASLDPAAYEKPPRLKLCFHTSTAGNGREVHEGLGAWHGFSKSAGAETKGGDSKMRAAVALQAARTLDSNQCPELALPRPSRLRLYLSTRWTHPARGIPQMGHLLSGAKEGNR
jgi:hypothetical protein